MNTKGDTVLQKIHQPVDLRQLSIKELPGLCQELRQHLIDILSQVGGHFASNLGVVELTVALHYVYNTPTDRLIWDTGHQTYAHKVLTGRREQLDTIRQWGGLSGFPKREESHFDHYNTGHAGTAISQMLGEAIARDRLQKKHHCISIIGDAAIASGMAFEALNHGGNMKTNCLVVVNDNDMSISKNVGALNQYMNKIITSQIYNKWMKRLYLFLIWIPLIGPSLHVYYQRFLRSIKGLIADGSFFDNLGFRYIGPVNGHDVKNLVEVLRKIKEIQGPLILHVLTKKGKGFDMAEQDPISFHSVGKFDPAKATPATPASSVASTAKLSNLSVLVGETLIHMIQKNRKIVVITPAMIEGSGLSRLVKIMPEHVFDVGIAEQHSMTLAGALANAGMTPYLCIYSTFLNRAMDQLIQDVALMNLPVRLVIDRAGCVGPDGETHQGLYDLGFLLAIPNIAIFVPRDSEEVMAGLCFMESYSESPIALRFPKHKISSVSVTENETLYKSNQARWIQSLQEAKQKLDVYGSGRDLAIITIGFMRELGQALAKSLAESFGIRRIELLWIRPFDYSLLDKALEEVEYFILIEESYIYSGVNGFILQSINRENRAKHLRTFALPNEVIEQGTRSQVLANYGIEENQMATWIRRQMIGKEQKKGTRKNAQGSKTKSTSRQGVVKIQ